MLYLVHDIRHLQILFVCKCLKHVLNQAHGSVVLIGRLLGSRISRRRKAAPFTTVAPATRRATQLYIDIAGSHSAVVEVLASHGVFHRGARCGYHQQNLRHLQ